MSTKVTREREITFLLETPMFEKLEPSELMEIMHIVEIREYRAGDTVFREGDTGDAWFVLYRGAVDVLKQGATGERKINALEPKSCFGEIAILDGSPRSATIQTTEDSVVFRVPRDAFGELIDKGHLVAYKLLHEMAVLLATRQRSITTKLSALLDETEIAQVHTGIQDIVGESSVRE
ncbi:MAG: cyclic nucleotide-binding domain-containing protein [Thiohalobacterales bacterium]|nr:cyclic nucleotide-binding domain-containing protein [Thiohalobacterales bacterium]